MGMEQFVADAHTTERIDAATAENRHFVEINNVQTLAQIFTDIRYTRKDNEAISATLIKALRRQGFSTTASHNPHPAPYPTRHGQASIHRDLPVSAVIGNSSRRQGCQG